MSALSEVKDLSAQKHGNRADSSELSSCRQQSWAFLTTHSEVVNCSTVSLPLVAESLATKPLMSHHPCFIQRGVLLQVARSFEQFVKKEKAKHGDVPMPGSMHLTNVSN